MGSADEQNGDVAGEAMNGKAPSLVQELEEYAKSRHITWNATSPILQIAKPYEARLKAAEDQAAHFQKAIFEIAAQRDNALANVAELQSHVCTCERKPCGLCLVCGAKERCADDMACTFDPTYDELITILHQTEDRLQARIAEMNLGLDTLFKSSTFHNERANDAEKRVVEVIARMRGVVADLRVMKKSTPCEEDGQCFQEAADLLEAALTSTDEDDRAPLDNSSPT